MAFLKKYRIFLITMGIFSVVFLTVAYNLLKTDKKLPVFNPVDVNPELADPSVWHVGRDHRIADFSFVNQDGKTVTQKDYEGKIYVADFFFTTCQTICPIMTSHMEKVQDAIRHDPNVMILSHSVTPDIDTPEVLKAYAQKHHVDARKWNLVTGDKRKIFEIARRSYLAVKTGSEAEMYDMVHTENFVLVDRERRIRGFYDGTKESEIKRLIDDIRFLSESSE
ncbi:MULTISPECIES: SCO family protein [unclassified Flavobacterium]|uniref:SCO family protein n=1 Tax=unclassified Flavobacterium TaxID=196869 RepID=UPI001F14827B|nr:MULTISPECIES: SCO family protein [unclassified Flavobacterium]UMY66532.1 SCO family protein [Flavobacterium sp. HJ-32-4]